MRKSAILKQKAGVLRKPITRATHHQTTTQKILNKLIQNCNKSEVLTKPFPIPSTALLTPNERRR